MSKICTLVQTFVAIWMLHKSNAQLRYVINQIPTYRLVLQILLNSCNLRLSGVKKLQFWEKFTLNCWEHKLPSTLWPLQLLKQKQRLSLSQREINYARVSCKWVVGCYLFTHLWLAKQVVSDIEWLKHHRSYSKIIWEENNCEHCRWLDNSQQVPLNVKSFFYYPFHALFKIYLCHGHTLIEKL